MFRLGCTRGTGPNTTRPANFERRLVLDEDAAHLLERRLEREKAVEFGAVRRQPAHEDARRDVHSR